MARLCGERGLESNDEMLRELFCGERAYRYVHEMFASEMAEHPYSSFGDVPIYTNKFLRTGEVWGRFADGTFRCLVKLKLEPENILDA
jgi:hypothetical protein